MATGSISLTEYPGDMVIIACDRCERQGRPSKAGLIADQGLSIPEVCKQLGISPQSYYRYRKEYGGLKVNQAKRLKELEKENSGLRRAVSDLTLDKLIL